MRRADYTALFDRIEGTGADSRLHWASGPRAGQSERWTGNSDELPGEPMRVLGSRCYECDEGVCYAETLMGQPRLVVLGGGHVGHATALLGVQLGYHVVVADERPEFADPTRLPGVDKVICDSYEAAFESLPPWTNSYFVVVTPGHWKDQLCADLALRQPSQYVGMIGSKGKVATVRRRMIDAGWSQTELDRLHAPIGLDIGGREPVEIAVAICGEIIQVRSKLGALTFNPQIGDQIRQLADHPDQPAVLATIIGHGGSTPRDTGSRMLVTPAGLAGGSVGGGAVENAVIQRARDMLDSGSQAVALVDHDLSDSESARLGMICGGRIRVLLEVL